ncbi:MAG: hypothetical protein GX444_12160 [Myxococcales bacterium]|nr:hypothetical protein [Myxococcales bacterium]
MSNGRKILLLCWTLWPLICFFLFFAVVVGFAVTSIYREQTSARADQSAVAVAPLDLAAADPVFQHVLYAGLLVPVHMKTAPVAGRGRLKRGFFQTATASECRASTSSMS